MNWDDFCDNFDIVCSVHVSLNAFMDEIGDCSGRRNFFLLLGSKISVLY
jgi:hypothetical protein